MDSKLLNKANEQVNETFVLFTQLIKDFNKNEILKEDKELQEIIINIQNEMVEIKNESNK